MSRNRFTRQQARIHPDPRMGRMIVASLGMHLLIFAVFSGTLLPHFRRDLRPVYHVDLVNLPVKAPQAGRPDARPEKTEPKPQPKKPEPVRTATPKVPPASKKPAVAKAPAVKKAPKPEARYEDALSAIEKLKRKQEIEVLQERLAALGKVDTRQAASTNAPVGMPEGKGTEAGSSYDAWLHEYLKQAWTLSKYQVGRSDLEAAVTLIFDSRGNLIDYRFTEKSAEGRFDDSVRRAILQLKKLPSAPGERMEKKVVFNLKELLE